MNARTWKTLGITAGAAIAVVLAAGVIFAGRDVSLPPMQQPVILRGGKVTGNHLSTPSWSFSYDRAQTTPDGGVATITGVHDGVLYRHGKPYLRLSARRVSVNTGSFDFTATGDVHVVQRSRDGAARSFDTDEIEWNNAQKLLVLPHPSLVRTGDKTLVVRTITVNFTTGAVHLGNVSGDFAAPG